MPPSPAVPPSMSSCSASLSDEQALQAPAVPAHHLDDSVSPGVGSLDSGDVSQASPSAGSSVDIDDSSRGSSSLTPFDFRGYFSSAPTPKLRPVTAAESGIIVPVSSDEVVAEATAGWDSLLACLESCPPDNRDRALAAGKLIGNHEAVLRDLTNPSPISQIQLVRVPAASSIYADQALREVARRLIGRGARRCKREYLEQNSQQQLQAWSLTATYLSGRIHCHERECSHRAPDMSPAAAEFFRAELQRLWWMANNIFADAAHAGSFGRGMTSSTAHSASWLPPLVTPPQPQVRIPPPQPSAQSSDHMIVVAPSPQQQQHATQSAPSPLASHVSHQACQGVDVGVQQEGSRQEATGSSSGSGTLIFGTLYE